MSYLLDASAADATTQAAASRITRPLAMATATFGAPAIPSAAQTLWAMPSLSAAKHKMLPTDQVVCRSIPWAQDIWRCWCWGYS